MTSTTLSDKTIHPVRAMFLWQIRQSGGLLGVYTGLLVLLFLLPVFFTNTTYWDANQKWIDRQVISAYNVFFIVALAIMVVFALIFTVWNFGFLHDRRKIDLFHSLPIHRMSQYLGRLLAGIVSLIAPCVLVSVIALLGMLSLQASFAGIIMPLLNNLSWLVIGAIAAFSFTAFVATCSGTTLDTLVSSLLLSGSYPLLIVLGTLYISNTIPGVRANFNLFLTTALCPLGAGFAMGIQSHYSGDFPAWLLPVWWICLSAIFIALGIWVYNRRKSEAAQSVEAYTPAKLFVRIMASACAGMAVAAITLNQGGPGWFTFSLAFILGSVIAYICTELLYKKTLRQLHRHLAPYAGVMVIFAAFITIVGFGCFGVDTYVPDPDQVLTVKISLPVSDPSISVIEEGTSESVTVLPSLSRQQKEAVISCTGTTYLRNAG